MDADLVFICFTTILNILNKVEPYALSPTELHRILTHKVQRGLPSAALKMLWIIIIEPMN